MMRLRRFFDRHPRLDVVDRALGTPLYAFMAAVLVAWVVQMLRLPQALVFACVGVTFVVVLAVGWRDVRADLGRMSRRANPPDG